MIGWKWYKLFQTRKVWRRRNGSRIQHSPTPFGTWHYIITTGGDDYFAGTGIFLKERKLWAWSRRVRRELWRMR